MTNFHEEILDAPDRPKGKKPRLGLLSGFIIGLSCHFAAWYVLHVISVMIDGFAYGVGLAILAYVLANICAYTTLLFSNYKKKKSFYLFLLGLLVVVLSCVLSMWVMEGKSGSQIMDKPHIFSYPALSMLILQMMVFGAWIRILKDEKNAFWLIFLLVPLIFAIANA